ncbi:MAG: hypothetical protein WA957_00410 [Alteraurantiacibacter sp.]
MRPLPWRPSHLTKSTFNSATLYSGGPRGAEWHKWDLHIHTPASVEQHYGDAHQDEVWERYIDELEALPKEIRAVGINDYCLIDGYRRVRGAKDSGRLQNLDLILPVVELRLDLLAGQSDTRRVNFHVVFSDDLTPDQIESFFLRKLSAEIQLRAGRPPWRGDVGHRDGLISLGQAFKAAVPEEKRGPEVSDLKAGFISASVSAGVVREALSQSIFEGQTLTAIGLSEYGALRWEGAGAAVKRDVIERVDFVLTATPSLEKYAEQRDRLRADGVNDRLIDASDAHYWPDSDQPNRLGQTATWAKADLTFEGLRRSLHQFDERVFVGENPPKRAIVLANPTKFIRRIEVRKKDDAGLTERWFDLNLPLSPDLVAIIGNQGNGKSALTDVLALCGNAQVAEFSFLNGDKFCDAENKAGAFVARLTWADGSVSERSLDEKVDPAAAERVRYVPQRFFEEVTNETAVHEGGLFYGEIKKAIFSHVPIADRLGRPDFDSLVEARTREPSASIVHYRGELSTMNRTIAKLERACGPQEIARVGGLIEQKVREIAAHKDAEPDPVSPPPEAEAANHKVAALRDQESNLEAEIKELRGRLAVLKQQQQAVRDAESAIDRVVREAQADAARITDQLRQQQIVLEDAPLISIASDTEPLRAKGEAVESEIEEITFHLDSSRDESVAARLVTMQAERAAAQQQLQTASRAYQDYRDLVEERAEKLAALNGDVSDPESLLGLRHRLKHLQEDIPGQIDELRGERKLTARMIHSKIVEHAAVYKELTGPVLAHVRSEPLTRDQYPLGIDIQVVERDVEDLLFAMIRQDSGTFRPREAGRARLRDLACSFNFDRPDDAVAFAEAVLARLHRDYKADPPESVEIERLLKKGATVERVYDFLFGFEYLRPEYALTLGGSPLRRLSPGQRGILLLVFYLVVDRSNTPLIIDQPEGNLNNQSIYENLVPVFRSAKDRRQLIIVTHNPNLAVVCDAEQVVHASRDIDDGNRIDYESGSLEHPKFNRRSLDVLEGTSDAFSARRDTYGPYTALS